MVLSAIFLLLQYGNRPGADKDFQNMMIFVRFIFGLFTARIISIVLILILAFTLMRTNRIRAVFTAHATTFLFFAIFLIVGWLRPQRDVIVNPAMTPLNPRTIAESWNFPFGILLIYFVCVVVWFLVDFGIAKLIQKSKAKNNIAPTSVTQIELNKNIASGESN